jgi:hypothetical protein
MIVPTNSQELFGRVDYAAMRLADYYGGRQFPDDWTHVRPAVAHFAKKLRPVNLSGESASWAVVGFLLGMGLWWIIPNSEKPFVSEVKRLFSLPNDSEGLSMKAGFLAVPTLAIWLGSSLLNGGRR